MLPAPVVLPNGPRPSAAKWEVRPAGALPELLPKAKRALVGEIPVLPSPVLPKTLLPLTAVQGLL